MNDMDERKSIARELIDFIKDSDIINKHELTSRLCYSLWGGHSLYVTVTLLPPLPLVGWFKRSESIN